MSTLNEDKCQHGWSSTNFHSNLVNDILVALSKKSYIRAWKNHNGVFRKLYSDEKVKVGLPGSADITGIITLKNGIGARLEIEVKTGSGRQHGDQKPFQNMIEKMGGFYFVARSVEDALKFCDWVANRS